MTQALGARLSNGRRFLPLAATIVMFGLVYAFGVLSFPAMQDSQPLFNLVNTAPFLLIAVVGQTLVIISGGIDLSVGGVIALTTVATAALLQADWDPAVGHRADAPDGHQPRRGDGLLHHVPEGAALHRDPGRHVVRARDVLPHQRRRDPHLRPGLEDAGGHQGPHPGTGRPGHQDGQLPHHPRGHRAGRPRRWPVRGSPHPLRPDAVCDGWEQRAQRAIRAPDGPPRRPHEDAGLHGQRLLLSPGRPRLQRLRRVRSRVARDDHGADGHRGRGHRRRGPDRRTGLRAGRVLRRPHPVPHPEPDPLPGPAQLVVDEHLHRPADAAVHRRPERARHGQCAQPRESRVRWSRGRSAQAHRGETAGSWGERRWSSWPSSGSPWSAR